MISSSTRRAQVFAAGCAMVGMVVTASGCAPTTTGSAPTATGSSPTITSPAPKTTVGPGAPATEPARPVPLRCGPARRGVTLVR
jgi:hypothetical protein